MSILDQTQDLTGAERRKLVQLYDPPDFVKQASDEQLMGNPDTLAAHLYGVRAPRLYPCHTKAATWLSAAFFALNREKLARHQREAAEGRLREVAQHFQMLPQIEQLWEKIAADQKAGTVQLTDDDFALVWKSEGGATQREYPLRNAAEVKAASAWFGQYRDEFVFADRRQIASKILKKADAYGSAVEHSELLQKCAGFGYAPKEDVAEAFEKRAQLLTRTDPAFAREMRTFAGSVRGMTLEVGDEGNRAKIASTMDEIDRRYGLTRFYASGEIARPEDTLYGLTEKVASDFARDHVTTTTGAIFARTDLEKLSIEKISEWMGTEFADAVSAGGVFLDMTKLAEVLPTLPRDDAQMFDRMAASIDLKPVGVEKTAGGGIAPEELAALAAQYQPPAVVEL